MTRFSVPVRSSSTDAYWPVRPTLVRTASGSRPMSCPSTRAVPASGTSRVASIRTMVVLPAPLGPSRPKTVPRSTVRSTPSTAVVSPKRLTRPSASIAGVFSMALTFRWDGAVPTDGGGRTHRPNGQKAYGRATGRWKRIFRSAATGGERPSPQGRPHLAGAGPVRRSALGSADLAQPHRGVGGDGGTVERAAGDEHLVPLGQRDRRGTEVRHDDDGGPPLAGVAQRDDVLTGGQLLQGAGAELQLGTQRDRLTVHPQRGTLLALLDVGGELCPPLRLRQPGAAGGGEAQARRVGAPRQRHPAAVPALLRVAGAPPGRVLPERVVQRGVLGQPELLALEEVGAAG